MKRDYLIYNDVNFNDLFFNELNYSVLIAIMSASLKHSKIKTVSADVKYLPCDKKIFYK